MTFTGMPATNYNLFAETRSTERKSTKQAGAKQSCACTSWANHKSSGNCLSELSSRDVAKLHSKADKAETSCTDPLAKKQAGASGERGEDGHSRRHSHSHSHRGLPVQLSATFDGVTQEVDGALHAVCDGVAVRSPRLPCRPLLSLLSPSSPFPPPHTLSQNGPLVCVFIPPDVLRAPRAWPHQASETRARICAAQSAAAAMGKEVHVFAQTMTGLAESAKHSHLEEQSQKPSAGAFLDLPEGFEMKASQAPSQNPSAVTVEIEATCASGNGAAGPSSDAGHRH